MSPEEVATQLEGPMAGVILSCFLIYPHHPSPKVVPTCQVRVSRFYHASSPLLLILNRKLQISVRTAGPQPLAVEVQQCPCQRECPNKCQIDCQNLMKESNRMVEYQHIYQKLCENRCQKECQSKCQKECQNMHACIHKYIHQYIRWYIKNYAKIMCEHNASGRGSLEENNFVLVLRYGGTH